MKFINETKTWTQYHIVVLKTYWISRRNSQIIRHPSIIMFIVQRQYLLVKLLWLDYSVLLYSYWIYYLFILCCCERYHCWLAWCWLVYNLFRWTDITFKFTIDRSNSQSWSFARFYQEKNPILKTFRGKNMGFTQKKLFQSLNGGDHQNSESERNKI